MGKGGVSKAGGSSSSITTSTSTTSTSTSTSTSSTSTSNTGRAAHLEADRAVGVAADLAAQATLLGLALDAEPPAARRLAAAAHHAQLLQHLRLRAHLRARRRAAAELLAGARQAERYGAGLVVGHVVHVQHRAQLRLLRLVQLLHRALLSVVEGRVVGKRPFAERVRFLAEEVVVADDEQREEQERREEYGSYSDVDFALSRRLGLAVAASRRGEIDELALALALAILRSSSRGGGQAGRRLRRCYQNAVRILRSVATYL